MAPTRWLAALALSSSLVLAQGSPPPPSTGAEMPRAPANRLPSQAEAKPKFLALLDEAKAPKRDCAKLISPWARVLFAASRLSPDEVKANLEGLLWLARCAEKQHYFVLMGDIGDQMLRADPDKGHPELLARAMLGLNSPNAALKLLDKVQLKYVKDPDVALTTAKVLCRTRDWAGCMTAADKTVKLVTKPKSPEGKEVLNRAHKYRARAALHLGKLDVATKAVATSASMGGDADDLAEVKKAMVGAKSHKAVVEVDTQPIIALGIYHLLGKRPDARGVVRFFVDNFGEDRQFKLEAGIEGVTVTGTKVETVLGSKDGKELVVDLTPQLSPTFDLLGQRTPRSATLNLKVSVMGAKGEVVVFQDARELEVKPRDFLPTASFVDEEKAMNESHFSYIAAWVTPNHKSIEAFLTEAKQRAPRNTFSGEQSATIPQVKAIFDTLKAKGVSYVMNPEMLSGAGYGQRARLPSDVLASTNAQCLEGAILYATMMEAIGLNPAIVIVPGHAFVAWRTSPKDAEIFRTEQAAFFEATGRFPDGGLIDAGTIDDGGTDAGKPAFDGGQGDAFGSTDGGRPVVPERLYPVKPGALMFLETTMTHDATFTAAVNTGLVEYVAGAFGRNARVLMLPELRQLGIAPQPYE